jgi:hypothetical protein
MQPFPPVRRSLRSHPGRFDADSPRKATNKRSRAMTKRISSMMAIAGLVLAGVTVLGCNSSRTRESAGEFIDDSVISTKVRAAFLEDSALRKFYIGVGTYKDTVQLSGFVDSTQAARHAAEVAAGVHGVTKVKNDLIVK